MPRNPLSEITAFYPELEFGIFAPQNVFTSMPPDEVHPGS